MKSILLLSVVVLYFASVVTGATPQPRYLENTVNSTFNTIIRETIKPLDPIYLDRLYNNIDGNRIQSENITVGGFSNAYLSYIKLSGYFGPQLVATLEIPRVTANITNLRVELKNGTVGEGSASALLKGLTIHISTKINIIGLKVSNLQIRPHLDHGEITITGIEDEEVAQNITELFNDLINNTMNNDIDLHNKISGLIQEYINNR